MRLMSRIEQFIRRLTFPYQTKLTSNLRLQHLSIIQEMSDLYLFGGVDLFFYNKVSSWLIHKDIHGT